jgi:hypothetical protein
MYEILVTGGVGYIGSSMANYPRKIGTGFFDKIFATLLRQTLLCVRRNSGIFPGLRIRSRAGRVMNLAGAMRHVPPRQ